MSEQNVLRESADKEYVCCLNEVGWCGSYESISDGRSINPILQKQEETPGANLHSPVPSPTPPHKTQSQ